MSGIPAELPLCVVAALALIATVGVHAGFATGPQLRARMQLVFPRHHWRAGGGEGRRQTVHRPAGYVWSATRIGSGIRLRGSVPTDEDRRTLRYGQAHFPDLEVEDRLKVVKGAPPTDQWLERSASGSSSSHT
jgi:hypothetical protein